MTAATRLTGPILLRAGMPLALVFGASVLSAGSPVGHASAATVSGCVSNRTRDLTIPAAGSGCPAGTTGLSWRTTGRQGTAGLPEWGRIVPPRSPLSFGQAITFDGADLWVASSAHNSLTEVRASDATTIRVLSASKYGFASPTAVAAGDGDVWVANGQGNSVTEVRISDGALVRVVSGRRYGFDAPSALLVDGRDVWIASTGDNSLTEITASDGTFVRRLTGSRYGLSAPTSLAAAAGGVWVADSGSNSVTEVRASDGALIRLMAGSAYGFSAPSAIVSGAGVLWVISGDDPRTQSASQAELNPRTGTVLRHLRDIGSSPLPPTAIITDGVLWIGLPTYDSRELLIEENAKDGSLLRTVGPGGNTGGLFSIRASVGLAADGQHLWLANGELAELPLDGAPPAGPAISGCVSTRTRALTVPLPHASCGRGRIAISWQRNGPAGISGANGWPAVAFGLGLDRPAGIAYGDRHLWVTNLAGNSVTELNAADDSLVRVLTGVGLSEPVAVVFDGQDLWVANLNDTVTELNARSGTVVRRLAGNRYGFGEPVAMTVADGQLWVVNQAADSITKISASDGRLLGTISASSYGFDAPTAIATDGTDLWVANTAGNTVTELSASDGSLVRVLAGPGYGFARPAGIAVSEDDVWVTNSAANTMTRLRASDGSPIGTISGFGQPGSVAADGSQLWVVDVSTDSMTEVDANTAAIIRSVTNDPGVFNFGTAYPVGIATADGHVWVTNMPGGSITELPQRGIAPVPDTAIHACVSTSTRSVTVPAAGSSCKAGSAAIDWNITGPAGLPALPGWGTVVYGAQYQFNDPSALAADGGDLWVANAAGNSLTEVDAADGSLVRTVSGASYGFDQPEALLMSGGDLWVANAAGDSLTEVDASDGSLVRTVSGASYQFNSPDALAFDGSNLWVANADGNSLTELDASDGSLVRTVSGASYMFGSPDALAFDGNHIWVSNGDADVLTAVNASDGSLALTVPLPADDTSSGAILFADGDVWAGTAGFEGIGDILELSPSGAVVADPYANAEATSLVAEGGYIWATTSFGGSISQVSATAGFVRTIDNPQYALASVALAVADGRVWSANGQQDTLTELPPPVPGE